MHVYERTCHHVLTATVRTLWGSLEQSQAFPGVHVASGALKKEGVTVAKSTTVCLEIIVPH